MGKCENEKIIYSFEVINHDKNSSFSICFTDHGLSICSSKQLNIIQERTGFVHFRGFVPMCISPRFLCSN